MAKYYRVYNTVFEDIGNNTFRCIASYRRRMINVLMFNNDPDVSKLRLCNSKKEALESLAEDAYWDNAYVFVRKNSFDKNRVTHYNFIIQEV